MIDYDTAFHITSYEDFFTSYTHGDFGHVQIGNYVMSKIVGKEDICLKTNTSYSWVLKDVRHVLDIC